MTPFAVSLSEQLVTSLTNGVAHSKLYYPQHPKVEAFAGEFVIKLGSLLEQSGKDSYFLGVVEGQLVQDGRYLAGSTILGRRLIEFAELMNCGGFLFKQTTQAREVSELFGLYSELAEPTATLEEARGMLRARRVLNIELSPSYEHPGWFGQFLFEGEENWGAREADATEDMLPVYQSLFGTVEEAHSSARAEKTFDVSDARTVSERLIESAAGNLTDVLRMVRYPDYDSYTVGHSVRVALIAVLIGQRIGMAPELLTEVGTAGLLHDVGKSKIPGDILFKRGRLDEEERRIVARHAPQGAQILVEQGAGPLAIGAAWGHHVRHDRRGYPKLQPWGVTGRITALIQVCDVFEALTAIRPFKAAMTPRRAYETMLHDRAAFEPAAFSALVSAMGLYPPGSEVLLTNGNRGIVVEAGPHIDQPRVQLMRDVSGDLLARDDQVVVETGPDLAVAQLLLDEEVQWYDSKAPVLQRPEISDLLCTGHLSQEGSVAAS